MHTDLVLGRGQILLSRRIVTSKDDPRRNLARHVILALRLLSC